MAKWFRATTWFQRTALALLLLAVIGWVRSLYTSGQDLAGLTVFALLMALMAFRQQLLWRVRNRLAVTFLIFGVVPLFLISQMLLLTGEVLMGQFAMQRMKQAVDAKIESAATSAAQLAAGTLQEENLAANGLSAGPAPEWMPSLFQGLAEEGGKLFIAARVKGPRDAYVTAPLDEQGLRALAGGTLTTFGVLSGEVDTNISFGSEGATIAVIENEVRRQLAPVSLPSAKGWWDVPVAGLLAMEGVSSSGKKDVMIPMLSRPSLLMGSAFTGRMASVAIYVLIIIGAFFLIIEMISLVASIRLTRTIARSVDDIYRGTQFVATGDFTHQIPVRGKHQLSDLAASFNGMTARVRDLIVEVKQKQTLESELAIARNVQLALFPRGVPELRTLEIAGVCIPGRIVSGDYYDHVKLDDRYTAIALGDVSGKGVSAALLMASI